MEPLPYIFPHMLSPEDLAYETYIRGTPNHELFNIEGLRHLLHSQQLDEMRRGLAPNVIIDDTNGEMQAVMASMAEISAENSHVLELPDEQIENCAESPNTPVQPNTPNSGNDKTSKR